MTVGWRDGAPFFHAHACWRESDGSMSGGHILPDETIVSEPVELSAFGFAGGVFEASVDTETNFKLFEPRQDVGITPGHRAGAQAGARVFAVRVRPNQDLTTVLEEFCADHSVSRARVRGGVGSTIGARFADGRTVEHFATEVFVQEGLIAPGPEGALQALLTVGLVDFTGAIANGVLRRGDNPVLMTFELILQEL